MGIEVGEIMKWRAYEMKLACKSIGTFGPNTLVEVAGTTRGYELPIHPIALSGGGIEVGEPIARSSDAVLVEFPAEAFDGSWRAWVPAASVT